MLDRPFLLRPIERLSHRCFVRLALLCFVPGWRHEMAGSVIADVPLWRVLVLGGRILCLRPSMYMFFALLLFLFYQPLFIQ